jgi:hypothetical protein
VNVFLNDSFKDLGTYDLIVFNMPHVRYFIIVNKPSLRNLFDAYGTLLKEFLPDVSAHLNKGGRAVIVNSQIAYDDILSKHRHVLNIISDSFGVDTSLASSRGFILEPGEKACTDRGPNATLGITYAFWKGLFWMVTFGGNGCYVWHLSERFKRFVEKWLSPITPWEILLSICPGFNRMHHVKVADTWPTSMP